MLILCRIFYSYRYFIMSCHTFLDYKCFWFYVISMDIFSLIQGHIMIINTITQRYNLHCARHSTIAWIVEKWVSYPFSTLEEHLEYQVCKTPLQVRDHLLQQLHRRHRQWLRIGHNSPPKEASWVGPSLKYHADEPRPCDECKGLAYSGPDTDRIQTP